MLKRFTPQEQLEQIIDNFEPTIRRAFLEAIETIRSDIVIEEIITRLEKGDVSGAVNAVPVDSVAFYPLVEAIRQTYNAGGIAAVSTLPRLSSPSGQKVIVRFDARNIRAEQWLSQHSSTLITNIIRDQQQAIRSVLTTGMVNGRNPRSVALDIVGRVEKVTGKRTGGIIGLTSKQASYVENARQELNSGQPEALKSYLNRVRRDKRFDSTVLKAMNNGEPIPKTTITKMLNRYEASLLKLRGDTIARTEALESVNTSQQEAFQQVLDKTAYTDQDIQREWRCASDDRVRDSHLMMNRQKVKGMQTPFITPDGYKLRYPHDSSLGAPARETINCRCIQLIRLNYMKALEN